MREAVFEFEFLTPALLAGADRQSAEMRIPSLRGALRWWTRLLDDEGEAREKRFFGFVEGTQCRRSPLSLRLLESAPIVKKDQDSESLTGNNFDYFLWPLRPSKNGGKKNSRGVLDVGSRFKVSYRMNLHSEEIDDWILWSFLLFGSMGTRSRRAYGSLWPTKLTVDGEEQEIPDNMGDLLECADWLFENNNITLFQLAGPQSDYKKAIGICSKFLKTIRCGKDQRDMVASKWGKNDHDVGLNSYPKDRPKIYRAALGLPLLQRYSNGRRTVDYSIEGWDRMASPLHFKVIRMKEGLIPIMLVIYKDGDIPKDKSLIGRVNQEKKFYDLDLTLLKTLRYAKLKEALGDDPEAKFPGLKLLAFYPRKNR